MAATMFGIGTPSTFPNSPAVWGLSPYGGAITPGAGLQHLQQIQQLIQVVPQQLQQLHALQQQQLLYLQQLLQIVPAQLQQLQQLIQVLSQQAQVLQPIGQSMTGPLGFGLVPQVFGGQAPTQVM